jgi:hypothetical protein
MVVSAAELFIFPHYMSLGLDFLCSACAWNIVLSVRQISVHTFTAGHLNPLRC